MISNVFVYYNTHVNVNSKCQHECVGKRPECDCKAFSRSYKHEFNNNSQFRMSQEGSFQKKPSSYSVDKDR